MQYNINQLYELNIHSLRNIARKVGVKAPTTLKKKALINEILQIDSGKKRPCMPNKKGRPLKNNVEDSTIEIEKTSIGVNSISLEENIKKDFIAAILKEIEKKLTKLL